MHNRLWDYDTNQVRLKDAIKDPEITYSWICKGGHQYESSLLASYEDPQARPYKHTKCQLCKNKTEAKLHTWLKKFHSDVIYQPVYSWLKVEGGDKYRRFDFAIPEYNVIIELDGEQHFRATSKWPCCRDKDIVKMMLALFNGFRVIRITQAEVAGPTDDWREKLLVAIRGYKSINWFDGKFKYTDHKRAL